MRSREFVVESAKLWCAKVRINNPQYIGYIDAQVWASNANMARQLLKSQYNIQDHHVGSIKEIKSKSSRKIKESVDFEQMSAQQIIAVAQDSFAQIYPDIKLYGKSVVEGVGLTTAKGQQGAASAFAGGDIVRGAFYLTLNAYAEGDAMIVVVEDATAGNYKGAATAVIKSLFEAGERLYQTEQRELVINDNANAEVWSVIADRVGAEMMESRVQEAIQDKSDHSYTTAYHITGLENAEEIMYKGLDPRDGKAFLVIDEGNPKKLRDELYQVYGWLDAKALDPDEEMTLLQVDIQGLPLAYEFGWHFSTVRITPNRIQDLGPDALREYL